MSRRSVVLAASLLAIAFMESDSTSAQAGRDRSALDDPLVLVQPIVLTGPDIGFRLIRMDGSIPVGQIVVRVNGAWVAAETSKSATVGR